jgi:predicted SAM-dependent methyltransferase
MAGETKKTNILRNGEIFQEFCRGRVIDIGGGDNPVTSKAYVFDSEQGDAQNILDYFDAQSFDCVYGSHCLEHMCDVEKAIQQWWSLVRPAGYLIIVVPHEDLYEQGLWPSHFNSDH